MPSNSCVAFIYRPWNVLLAVAPLLWAVLGSVATAQLAAPEAPPETTAVADQITPADLGAQAVLVLHYHRPDGDYKNWNAWVWTDTGEGRAYDFDQEDEFGRYALVPVNHVPERYGFIIRRGEWEMKDIDRDRFAPNSKGNVTEVWITSGDPEVYSDTEKIDLAPKLTAAFLDRLNRLTVTSTTPIKSRDLKDAKLVTAHGEIALKNLQKSDQQAQGKIVYDITLRQPITPAMITDSMQLEVSGFDSVAVFARDVLDASPFSAARTKFSFGPSYTPEFTIFRTWSPVASRVEVLLYENGIDAEPTQIIALTDLEPIPDDDGVWHGLIKGDFHNTPYQYRFTSYGQERTVADIHGFAALPGSQFSVVVDLDRTDPEGFEDHAVPTLKNLTDEVIYEVHVRDFSTTDPNTPPEFKGKYPGLVTAGAIEPGDEGVVTGIAHLKQLGVTAVHLLPIHDFGGERHEYNWGYWTSLFNVPESDYSTTPDDPAATIRELKQTIQTLHENDLRVILDVVYNHTSSSYEYSAFDQAVPWYYFRTTPDGALRNDAGVGNSVADERAMVRKYIIDSLIYWADEYKVDGFRFDLIGTHRPETVKQLVQELRSRRPDLTIYGEPWTGGGPTYFPKGAQKNLGLAVFNDHLRNAIRGDLDGKAIGFANGPGGDTAAIQRGIAGAIDDFTADPTETINYVSAHDNRTLWDKLEYTLPNATEAERRAMHKLSLGVVLTSQGIPFLHGGSDMARTKGGHHNSYNQGDDVNAFGWDRKAEYRDVFDYTAGLIALRKAHPAFRMTTAAQVRKNLKFLDQADLPEGVIAFTLNGRAVCDGWNTILVAYNGEPTAQEFHLPAGKWNVVVNAGQAGNQTLGTANGKITLPPFSMVVMHP